MIKVNINGEKNKCEIQLAGSGAEIIAEIQTLVEKARKALDEQDFGTGLVFKLAVASAAFDMPFDEVKKLAAKAFGLDEDGDES